MSIYIKIMQQTEVNPKIEEKPEIQIPDSIKAEKKQSIAGYEMLETLGKGTFGKVKAAIHIQSGEKVAIKVIDKASIKDDDDQERVARQVQILRMLRHPNIVQLYEVIETDFYIYLIMQYVEQGQLFKLMSEQVRLGERASGRIFIQIMNAVEYLHRLGIAHRDLKPENILLDTDFNIKLVDFGLSNFVEKSQLLQTACGSPCYAPPQMVSGKNYDGQIGDIWSMGIIFYGMICGSLPFEEKTTRELYQKVIDGFYVIPSDISLEAIEVIRSMLVTDPSKRISIPQLRKLRFFKQLEDVQAKIIGIIIGFHPMPIDNEILDKMKEYTTIDREKIQEQIKQNQQTASTTLYYLLQKRSLRDGGRTIVDLQAFLESHEKYKKQYGVLPQQFEQENKKTPETKKNGENKDLAKSKHSKSKESETSQKQELKPFINKFEFRERFKSKIKLPNKKGLTKQKRKPLSIIRNHRTLANTSIKSQEKQIPRTTKFYEKKGQKDALLSTRIYTQTDDPRNSNRNKQSKQTRLEKSTSERKKKLSKKKSGAKLKLENNNRLALNLWDAYFQKPLEQSINKAGTQRWTSSHSGTINTARKVKQKQQQQNNIFNENIKRLKNGFLKLPMMKKEQDKQLLDKSVKFRHERIKTLNKQGSTQKMTARKKQ